MKSKFTVEQKYQIVMESFNSTSSTNDLCRRNGVAPVNFRKWREKFMEGGKRSLAESGSRNDYEDEIDRLKMMVGDQAMVIGELKKISAGRRR
ncbi:transposase IS3/IS911 family protein [mine drainage metagenome]|uniref:Transposase IS3/IS911 family protein n=1 Tax=mine drainage metagenome TaxID=410659 RepID=T1CCU8_9ZZZZ